MLITPQIKSGTVPGFNGGDGVGLLQTLVTWVTSNPAVSGLDWEIKLQQSAMEDDGVTVAIDSDHKEYILFNDGLSGTEDIYIGIRECSYASSNFYTWNLNGYHLEPSTWNGLWNATHGLSSYDSTLNSWDALPALQLFDSEIAYWFYSTSEFIFVSARVGTSYYQCYLGNGARLGDPAEHPYPLVIAGSEQGDTGYQSGGYGPVRPMNDADECSAFCIDPSGNYKRYGSSALELSVLPMQGNTNTTSVSASTAGAALIMPCYFVTEETTTAVQLYNVGAFRRTNAQSEQKYVDDDANMWRCFAQGQTDYDYDFLAVLEEENYSTTTTTGSTTTSSETTTSTSSTTSTTTTTV